MVLLQSVCVRPTYAAQAVANTKGSEVKVDVVIGFPEGTQDLTQKMSYVSSFLSSLSIVLL